MNAFRATLFALSTFSLLTAAGPSHADKAFDQYLALSPTQHHQLEAANKSRKSIADPAKAEKDSATQNLIGLVIGNTGDSGVQPVLNQVLSDTQTIDNAEDTYWQAIQGFLTPTQVAKIYLRNHPPKGPPPPPAPKPPGSGHPSKWDVYFGFNPQTEGQFKAADKAKNASLKGVRQEKDAAVEQLRQLVQSGAADSAIQPTLATLFKDIQTEHQTEETFWGSTLPGFLAPTQVAKIYLHRHAPKGSFNPSL